MKLVTLIKLDTEKTMVSDYADTVQFHSMDFSKSPLRVNDSSEYLPQFIEEEIQPVHKVVDHGVEHYISVNNKVWEYLYLIENPVTAKTQQATIDDLKDYKYDAMVTIEIKAMQYKRIVTASLWTRIKWLFTGAK